MRPSFLATAILAGIATFAGPPSGARADAYPTQTIRIVTAYAAGGVSDTAARILAETMQAQTGKPVLVENKPGANGVIGTGDVIRAKPDGYTLLISGFGGTLIPPLIIQDYPFDIPRQLIAVAGAAEFINVMIVNNDLPVKNFAEFVAYAKARPDQMNFGSSGVGSSSHLAGELFMQQTGVKMVHVPYKGGAAAINDLRGGNIQVVFDNLPAVIGQVKAGAVKPLLVTSNRRSDQLPEVPTPAESGFPDFTVTSWLALYAPAGMQPDRLAQVEKVVTDALRSAEVRGKFEKIGFVPTGLGHREVTAFTEKEFARWGEVVRAAGIKLSN